MVSLISIIKAIGLVIFWIRGLYEHWDFAVSENIIQSITTVGSHKSTQYNHNVQISSCWKRLYEKTPVEKYIIGYFKKK